MFLLKLFAGTTAEHVTLSQQPADGLPCLLCLATNNLQQNVFIFFERDGQYSRTGDTFARLILVMQDMELI